MLLQETAYMSILKKLTESKVQERNKVMTNLPGKAWAILWF